MKLAILHPKMDPASRRFVVWMAIGTVFLLALAATDYFGGAPIW